MKFTRKEILEILGLYLVELISVYSFLALGGSIFVTHLAIGAYGISLPWSVALGIVLYVLFLALLLRYAKLFYGF